MPAIEISILGQKYVLKGDDDENHLKEVAELVRRRVESLKKEKPALSLHKAAMLAAFDFASDAIKGKRKAVEYRATILTKAHQLLEKVETELASHPPTQ